MARRTFDHAHIIHATPAQISDALTHYEFFLAHGIHRNLSQVTFLGEESGADGITRRVYRNAERVRLGPFHLTVTNRAVNYINAEGAVVGEAFQSPGVHIMVVSRCIPQDDASLVAETVILDAPRLLMPTVFSQAKRAHAEKLAKLDAYFSTLASGSNIG